MTMFDSKTIERDGTMYRVEYHYDLESGAPWENEDGHGPVEKATIDRYTGEVKKRPGQVVLYRGDRNEYSYLYDFAEALKIAKRDGWDAKPYGDPGKALRAVNADMRHLRGWLTNDWSYVGVVVFPLTDDGDELRSKSVSLWGIESSAADYIEETILELLKEFDPE